MPSLIVADYHGAATGIRRFLMALVGNLLQVEDFVGWQVHVAMPAVGYHGASVEWPPVQDSRVTFSSDGDASRDRTPEEFRFWIETVVSQHSADAVYIPYPYLSSCPELPIPKVVTFHDFNYKRFDTLNEDIRDVVERELPRWLRESVPVVSSRFIADEFSGYHPEIAQRVREVPLGIGPQPKWNETQWARFRQQHRIPERYILTPGWLAPHKNLVLLLEALAILRQHGIQIPCIFTGPNSAQLGALTTASDSYPRRMIHVARALGLRYGTDFCGVGEVEDLELEMLYAHAAAMVMPTLYESVGLPVPEAMRARCPVICSNIPALREVLDRVGPGSARTFNPLDPNSLAAALRTDLQNPNSSRARADQALGQVSDAFDPRKTAQGYAHLFSEAIAG